jgi:beta-phosphoglucomutase-like phosphatase (HAD superfamily)
MLDVLFFDIDGSLLESNPAHVAAWAEAFEGPARGVMLSPTEHDGGVAPVTLREGLS